MQYFCRSIGFDVKEKELTSFHAQEWAKIPADVDVLLTHTPPATILDVSPYTGKPIGRHY